MTKLFTPGRVNLIGEHLDYNGGMVLPTALPLGTTIELAPRTDDKIIIRSDKFDGTAMRALGEAAKGHWSDYAGGAVIMANKAGMMPAGVQISIETSLPFGAGLSSSASVIVGILKIVRNLSGAALPDIEIAKLARRVENEYIGVPCGIMDQIAVAITAPGHALAIDTQSLAYQSIALPKDYHMAVVHSGIYRSLSEGRYAVRKAECDEVKSHFNRADICNLAISELETLAKMPRNIFRRARHCISEQRRTLAAIDALKTGEISAFGKLMSESHISMRDDFEITLPAIDCLAEDAVNLGALGARMTGGGFGGCIVACIAKADLKTWTRSLLSRHPDAFFVC